MLAFVEVGSAGPRKVEEMNSLPPYGQPFATPQLSSLSAAKLGNLRGSISRAGAVDGRLGPIEWMIAGVDGKWLVGAGPFAHWIIDRARPTATTAIDVSGGSFISMVSKDRYIFNSGSSLVVRRLRPFADWHSDNAITVRLDKFGGTSIPYGIYTLVDEFTLVSQMIGHPGKPSFRELCVSRKSYEDLRPDMRWSTCLSATSARSPFLSDGTLVLFFPDSLRIIDSEGKETATIKATLKPGMVSVDAHDLIWGYSATSPELLAFNRLGKQVAQVPFSGGTPTQPPVALADGRIVAVTADGLECIRDQKSEWQATFAKLPGLGPVVQPKPAKRPGIDLSGGQDPLATASVNGKLLVKRGSWLMLFDDGPTPVWIRQVPGGKFITSNVVITSDGAAYFAAGLEYFRIE